MTTFFETKSYLQGGFTEDQQEYFKEYRLSQKGIHSWGLIHELYDYARNLCSIYDISFCRDESCCFIRHKHLSFQCEYNDDETLASYAKGNYDFYDAEQIEEFVIFKGAYEITSFLKNIDDAPYKSENLDILNYCFEDFNDNYYIIDHLKRFSPQEEETNALQDSTEEEIAETECSLDKNEEESDEQKEEELSSYPSLPTNESNSLTLTLYDCPPCLTKEDECYIDCYDPMDSFEISLFDEIDACGHDALMNETCKDDFATVIYDKPCYLDESYDKPLFLPTMDVLNDDEVCLESLHDCVLVDHEKHALCDGYEFVHHATENYYE